MGIIGVYLVSVEMEIILPNKGKKTPIILVSM